MATVLKTNSHLEAEYRSRTPGSARLYAEAARVLPSGVAHDSRHLLTFRNIHLCDNWRHNVKL
jgi:hypothetical protein